MLGIGVTDPTCVIDNDIPATSGSAAGFAISFQNVGFGRETDPDVPASNKAFIPGRTFNASVGPGDSARKLLTMRRKLLLRMKEFISSSDQGSNKNFELDALQFGFVQELHDKFCEGVDVLKDSELENQLMENISEQYGKCYKLFQRSELRFNQKFSKQMQLDKLVDDTIDPSDSASQVTKASVTSSTSLVLKRIELERKKAESDSLEQLSLSRAEVRALAKEAEVRARAEEAEVLAKLRIEKANIEAQKKILECSQQGSRVSRPSKTQTCLRSVR